MKSMLSRVICDNFVPEAPFLLLLALRILCENLIRLGLHPHHPLSPPHLWVQIRAIQSSCRKEGGIKEEVQFLQAKLRIDN